MRVTRFFGTCVHYSVILRNGWGAVLSRISFVKFFGLGLINRSCQTLYYYPVIASTEFLAECLNLLERLESLKEVYING